MKAVRYYEHGGTDVLTIDEVDRPEPGVDEVLVENRAVGINHVDTLFREGIFAPSSLPAIPGSDFAGVVIELGNDVTDFAVGDRVVGAGLGGDRPGSYAEYVVAPSDRLAQLPTSVDFTDGAGMGHVGTAAWQAVIHYGELEPGEIFLLHGGGGGLGHIAVQLAAAAGATVITTEADAETRERLEALGADATFDYRRDDLADAILDVGEPDLIVDYHFDRYVDFDIEHIAHGGRISVLEYSTEEDGEATIAQSTLRAGILKDVDIQLIGIFNAEIGAVLGRLARLIEAGDLRIEVAATYDLTDVAQAHHDIVESVTFGKRVFDLR